ncbi:hypothetical protein QQX09_01075 [Demequina sp. SYSU T00192]|uniref:Uncharacterized protein n=1 Tax=Demequina litoralis TaxID=3051660 RepID=A0ABT8G5M8_9MICO|nr:hypothetical protein [Demequina sp. SYSU T00192]MDN4474441.1 hypothetical protein [Demequina sp. SYSU T00192]
MRRGLWAALAAGALAAAGCSGGSDAGPTSLPSVPNAFASVQPGVTEEIGPAELVDRTVRSLDQYWAERIPGFSSPGVQVYDEDDDELPGSSCAESAEDYFDTSFYCAADAQVLLNLRWLFLVRDAGYEEEVPTSTEPVIDPTTLGGDEAVAWVVAHEYARHVAAVRGTEAVTELGASLQADCRTGMFFSALASEEYPVKLDPATDGWLGAKMMYVINDETVGDSAWFDAAARGSARQRAAAWSAGLLSENEDLCDAYAAAEQPPVTVDLGTYDVVLPPTLEVDEHGLRDDGATYAIAASSHFDDLSVALYGIGLEDAAWAAHLAFDDAVTAVWGADPAFTLLDDPSEGSPVVGATRYLTLALSRYSAEGADGFGVVTVVTSGGGDAWVIDVRRDGISPEAASESDWTLVEDLALFVESSMSL